MTPAVCTCTVDHNTVMKLQGRTCLPLW